MRGAGKQCMGVAFHAPDENDEDGDRGNQWTQSSI